MCLKRLVHKIHLTFMDLDTFMQTQNADEKGNITIWSKGLFFPSTEPLQIYFSSTSGKHCSPLGLINITKLIYFWVKLSALYIEATHGLL